MKKLLFLTLLGLSLLFFAGCEEKENTNTETAAKCETGKCNTAMKKSEMPAQESTADGKCGKGKCGDK